MSIAKIDAVWLLNKAVWVVNVSECVSVVIIRPGGITELIDS